MTHATTPRSADLLTPVTAAQLRWTDGFWGRIQKRTRTVTVPTMWESLSDPQTSPGWRNFLIAAGRQQGAHEGPPFLDGDLYKWLESAISAQETGTDPDLDAVIDQVIELIASLQRDDGYLHTPTLIAGDAAELANRFNFETFNLGHLITAGVRHHRITGRRTLLDVAVKAAGFLEALAAEHPDVLARSAICPSHYMAVVELYRATGDDRYLRLAEAFLRARDDFNGGDDNQDRLPVREQRVVTGHAVRANYLYAGLADLAAETGDAELRRVLEVLWQDVVDHKLYLTGGCGALYDGASPNGYPWQGEISRVHQAYGHAYQLPHTTAHNESCANIGMILWSERMLALTGEARYADVIEQVAYNSLLASISTDGERYFYTNPLRQVRGLPYPLRMPGETAERPVPDPPPSEQRQRARYLSCFCCPPNIARTLARFHERAMSVSESAVWIHLYNRAEVRAEITSDRVLGLQLQSDQPWGSEVAITVTEAIGQVGLRLRIPGWAGGATVMINGDPIGPFPLGAYLELERSWHPGDRIELTLPMPVRLRRGHRLAEELTNQVAVTRGPLVYCLESADLPDGVRIEQIALRRTTTWQPTETEIDGHRVVALEGEAALLPTSDDDRLYTDVETADPESIMVRLIPYHAWGNRGAGEMSVWLPLVW